LLLPFFLHEVSRGKALRQIKSERLTKLKKTELVPFLRDEERANKLFLFCVGEEEKQAGKKFGMCFTHTAAL
jgi:hypothetical protein